MDFNLDASHVVAALVAIFGAGGGFWAWLTAKAKGRTDLVAVAQEAASKLIGDQTAEITRLRDQYDRLEKRFDDLEGAYVVLGEANRALLNTNESLSRQNAQLTHELAAATARVEQVTQELRQHKQLLAGSTEPRVIEVLEQRAQAAALKADERPINVPHLLETPPMVYVPFAQELDPMASRLMIPGLEVKEAVDAELQHKTGAFELKDLDEDGTFEGYASVFGVVDDGADIVMKGAFKRSLKERPAKAVKMLYQHNPDQPIGVYTEMKEDDKGLWVKGRLVREAAKGAECYALMKAGALDGMSIGYRTIRAERDERTGVRSLKELELWEVSIVTFPMLAVARVSGVKKDWSERMVERYLREAGMPNEFAKNVVLHGFKRASEMSGHPREEEKGLSELLANISRVATQIKGT